MFLFCFNFFSSLLLSSSVQRQRLIMFKNKIAIGVVWCIETHLNIFIFQLFSLSSFSSLHFLSLFIFCFLRFFVYKNMHGWIMHIQINNSKWAFGMCYLHFISSFLFHSFGRKDVRVSDSFKCWRCAYYFKYRIFSMGKWQKINVRRFLLIHQVCMFKGNATKFNIQH